MELSAEIVLSAAAAAAWAVLGDRFDHTGEWAAPIHTSSLDGDPEVEAVRTGRRDR